MMMYMMIYFKEENKQIKGDFLRQDFLYYREASN